MYKSFSKVVLRAPAQSIANLGIIDHNKSPLLFLEGLYLSSPEYLIELEKIALRTGKEKQKLLDSFTKYWVRSCTRCTPFATFAGCALLNISEGLTHITLHSQEDHVKKVRIDMNYLSLIISSLIKDSSVMGNVLLHPNNSIYELFDEYRYVEYVITNNTRYYHLTSVEKTPYLKNIIEAARMGSTVKDLSKTLIIAEDVTEEEAVEFIGEIIRSQILMPDIEPAVTGADCLQDLIVKLSEVNTAPSFISNLNKVQELINNPQKGTAYYQNIEEYLRLVDPNISQPKNTIQTDLFLSLSSKDIQKEIIETIIVQLSELLCFSVEERHTDMEAFINKFINKYEESEVPLSIALDIDDGIGYGSYGDQDSGGDEIIDNLAVPATTGPTNDFNFIQRFAFTKYNDYLKNKDQLIQIEEEELKTFKKSSKEDKLPNSMYIMGSLLKIPEEELDETNFLFDLTGFGGPSGANLLGRFTHGSAEMLAFTKSILSEEEKEYPDFIYAEIVHLPQARLGNVLLRPVLRNYEIPYVGISGSKSDRQISIDDLMVSIKNRQVFLRSKQLNKFIIPRLTTAHNYHYKSLPIYKFLCDLQRQGNAIPFLWDWGNLKILNTLPRVCYKNIIVKKAEWVLALDEAKQKQEDESGLVSLRELWKKRALPDQVVYSAGDNDLLIQYNNDDLMRIMWSYLNKYKRIRVVEYLATPQNCILKDVNNLPFTNELIIPVYKEPAIKPSAHLIQTTINSSIKRSFNLGSEWLYFKIYCGPKQTEKILISTVLPFIKNGLKEGLFEKFFFIRYRDDMSHLRIRFFNKNRLKNTQIQAAFTLELNEYIHAGLIDKVVIDTYKRELERYIPELIEQAESLFFHDSKAVLKLIANLTSAQDEKNRILFALIGINELLNDFNLATKEKYDFAKVMQTAYFREYGESDSLQKQLNAKYRVIQKEIANSIENRSNESPVSYAFEVFKERSLSMENEIKAILEVIENERHQKLTYLLTSYIHMFINRMFIGQQRKYELLIYHFFERYLFSKTKQLMASLQVK